MTKNKDSVQKPPLSSSSSSPSGTTAFSVSIDGEQPQEHDVATDAAAPPAEAAGEQSDNEPAVDGEGLPSIDHQSDQPDSEAAAPSVDETAGEAEALAGDLPFAEPQTGDTDSDVVVPEESEPVSAAPAQNDEQRSEAGSQESEVEFPDVSSAEVVSSPIEPAPVEAEEIVSSMVEDAPLEPEEVVQEGAPQVAEPVIEETASQAEAPAENDIRLGSNGVLASEATTEELREAVRNSLAGQPAENEQAFALFNQMTSDLRAVMEDARDDATRVSFKLMEFAQASFQNNVTLARDYASVRSVPDLFNIQSSYIQRQMELLNSKAEELRMLTSEIASKKAEKLQNRLKAD